MKEITRIHLAKTAFSVEIDAKKSLEKYLNSIQKNMHADAEAMKEIEARMVEILAERGVMKKALLAMMTFWRLKIKWANRAIFRMIVRTQRMN